MDYALCKLGTPLNIICGFTQVLTASLPDLPEDEIADITGRIAESATAISRLAEDLFSSEGVHS